MPVKHDLGRTIALVAAATLVLITASATKADALSLKVTERVAPGFVQVGDLVTVPLLGEHATRRVVGAHDIAQGTLLTLQVEGSRAPDAFGVLLSEPTDVVRAQIPYAPAIVALAFALGLIAVRPSRRTTA